MKLIYSSRHLSILCSVFAYIFGAHLCLAQSEGTYNGVSAGKYHCNSSNMDVEVAIQRTGFIQFRIWDKKGETTDLHAFTRGYATQTDSFPVRNASIMSLRSATGEDLQIIFDYEATHFRIGEKGEEHECSRA